MSEHKWIAGAITHHGAFKKKAKAAGMSTEEYAKKMQKGDSVTAHQARLALTLMHLSGHMPKKKHSTGIGSNAQQDAHDEKDNG